MRDLFLPFAKPYILDEEIEEITQVLRSGFLTTGPKVTEFEQGICNYIGDSIFAVGLNSCTAGLYLSLVASGVSEGDEVIVPTWTFAATAHVVLWCKAKPVLCDIDEGSLNIDVQKAELLVNPRTKAIIPVHYAGFPCDMDALTDLTQKNGITVIEDAAHAIGSRYKGRAIGSFGNLTVFSFYATKNLTCGEGGMVVGTDPQIIEKIRKLSYFGINKGAFQRYTKTGKWAYEIEELGYKFNMDSIHAALGVVQLRRLDFMNERRRRIAAMYRDKLDKRIIFPADSKENYHTYHLFPIRVDRKIISRDNLIAKLAQRNIGTSVHFIPLHRHSFYKNMCLGKFPVSDRVFEEIISIPMFPGMVDSDVNYVIDSINDILKSGG